MCRIYQPLLIARSSDLSTSAAGQANVACLLIVSVIVTAAAVTDDYRRTVMVARLGESRLADPDARPPMPIRLGMGMGGSVTN